MTRVTLMTAATFAILLGTETARAGVLYNATGGVENGGDPLSAAGPILADRFITTGAGSLTAVSLNLSLVAGTVLPSNAFLIDLFADAGIAGPGAATRLLAVLDASLTTSFQLKNYVLPTPVSLAANSSYYIGIQDLGGSAAVLGNTVDPVVLADPTVAAGAVYFNNGGVQANVGGPYDIIVTGTPVPAPAGATMVAAMALAAMRRRARTSALYPTASAAARSPSR